MERWQNRVALVTGASTGIGAELCKMLSENGMIVVGCARKVERIQEMANNHNNIRPYKVKQISFFRKKPKLNINLYLIVNGMKIETSFNIT